MGRFSKYVQGVSKIQIDTEEFEVKPIMTDCDGYSVVQKTLKKDEALAMKKNIDLLYMMIVRDTTDLDDEDKVGLKNFLYLNQKQALEETAILFKWTTKEERDRHKAMIEKHLEQGTFLKNMKED